MNIQSPKIQTTFSADISSVNSSSSTSNGGSYSSYMNFEPNTPTYSPQSSQSSNNYSNQNNSNPHVLQYNIAVNTHNAQRLTEVTAKVYMTFLA
ncbi:hypothetical protein Hanom_Chr17g01582421 [Helianthus anomalus]